VSIGAAIEVVPVIAVGTGVGAAVGAVVGPKLQDFLNEQWAAHPDKPPAASLLANGVAQGQVDEAAARQWAKETGFGEAQFSAMVAIADTGPGMASAFELWRRGKIDEGAFRRALKRNAIEPEWIEALVQIKEHVLTPADLANAVQQGFVPGAGLLPGGGEGATPITVPFTEVQLDTLGEFAAAGIDPEHAQVLSQLVGLPPGVMELLTMWNRGIITETSVEHGVREGHTKTKWTGALKELRHAVLSAAEYASARLRGWVTEEEAVTGGALTGHSRDQMELLYLNRGQPIAPVQAYTAHFRGSPGPVGPGYTRGPHPFDEEDFLRALRQSDVRTEYGPTLWANRYAYPSLFQLRRAVESGAITPARALVMLHYQRYEPQDATALVASMTQGGAAGAKELTKTELAAEYEGRYITEAEYRAALGALGYAGPALELEVHLGDARRVKKYRDAIVSELHGEYIAHDVDDADVQATLAEIGVPADAVAQLLALWAIERRVHRRQLTAAQVKRGYKRGHITLAAAQGRLADLGYDAAETEVLLD